MHPYVHDKADDNRPDHTHHYMHADQLHEYPTRFSKRKHLYTPNTACLRFAPGRDTFFDTEYHTQKYAKVWNSIPLEIREQTSRDTFTKELTKYLLEKQSHL